MNQKVVVTMLEREGHIVTVANNGRAALGYLSSEKFDLVLMDVQMPEMDGLEAATAVRVQERRIGTHVPIIAMTAHALKGDRERCLEAGMDEYIAKPIHWHELMETIERTIGSTAVAEQPFELAPPGRDVMDWNEVLKTAKGDHDVAEAIVTAAREEMPRLQVALRDATVAGDHMALRLAAHTLKGSVQYFGASRLFELARELELLGQEGDLDSAHVVLPQLEEELTRFVDVLAKHQRGEYDND